ncbi:matrix-remodeling-associated protein 5-like [Pholidichthys leucotaenia]
MYRSVCEPGALVAFLVLTLGVSSGQSCPRSCNCYQANEVHCTFRSLLSIPPGLPAHTRRINLGFNSISRLHDKSLAGLKRTELLMLHSNDLHHLPDRVFRDMSSLQILKLSYNKLTEISSSLTFSGLTSLLRLYLDHNLLQHIHPRALLQLPSLRLIRLQGNKLHQLHPHTLCTLSLLNTYFFSTLRHLDLSNNTLTTLPKDVLATAPFLETLVLHHNPWSCDCWMNWLLRWSLAHPGLLKCPGGAQCPVCASPSSLQGQGVFEQADLACTSPVISTRGKETPLESELSEIQSSEAFREPLGTASLGLSDQQGYSVDLSCNITHSSDSQDIAPPPDLSLSSSSPLPLALSLYLECPVERQSYEKLWRILAYYSETAVRLEWDIMLRKAPALAYRYRQAAETEGYYHTGVKASIKASPEWLLQSAVSIQLNRAQSNGHKVQLIYSTRVSAHPDPTSHFSSASPETHPWVLISTNQTTTAWAAVAGSKVKLPCSIVSSGNPKTHWILPDGSKLIAPSGRIDGRLQASGSALVLQNVQLSDAGIYYCVARAGRDVDVLPLRLAVEESSVPPSGEQVGPEVMGTFGEPVSLPCQVSGSPEPYMSWILPDGNAVRRGLAVSSGLTIESNGSLSLSNPSVRDAGHYRCIAVNMYGSYSLSTHLIINPRQMPPLQTSFPRGPQSVAGRSTKIRAPLLHQEDEGSGDREEDDQRTSDNNRKSSVLFQHLPDRHNHTGKPQRRGPHPMRRRPVSYHNQRINRFESRHRVPTTKNRIDPQKWADILAKIRQKTSYNNNQSMSTRKPTVPPIQENNGNVTSGPEVEDVTESRRTQGTGVEAEGEGSSIDDTYLQEEELQLIQPVEAETPTETNADIEIDTNIETDTEKSTEAQTEVESESETQSEIATNPVTQKATFTSNPISGTNEIVQEKPEENQRGTNPNLSGTIPQNPRQGLLPNLVLNTPATVSTTSATIKTATATTTSTSTTLSAKIPSATEMTTKPSTMSSTVIEVTSTNIKSSREGLSIDQADPRGRFAVGSPNRNRPPTDWKNPGANSIPDPHSSRSHWSPSIHVAPVAPVLRSRPKIADPHIRTVSFPAVSTAKLTCEAQGEPKPSFTWTKVATGAVMSVHSRAQRFEVLPNGTLVIQNVQLQDRGTYICSAQNVLGRDRLLTSLEVWTRPPRMLLPSYREASIHQGGEVRLECQADGVPTPLLSWILPDRSVLTTNGANTSRLNMDTNGTLHISVTLPSDRGIYRCVASNSAGATSASVRVHVSSLPPVIQQPREEHLQLSPGWPVYAHCSARGAPLPTVRWRIPDGTLVRPSQFLHGNLFVLTNGTLHIRKVGPKDSGNYECTASNAVGTDKRTVRVEIEGERRHEEKRYEGAKAVNNENISPSSSAIKDRTLTMVPHPSHPVTAPKIPSPPFSKRSKNSPFTPSSTYPHNSSKSSPESDTTLTSSATQLNTQKTSHSSISPSSTVLANNTNISPIANTKRTGSVALPLSPFSKAHIVFTSPSMSSVPYGGILQLHCSVTGNPVPIIIWRTPARKLVDMHLSFDQRLKVHPNGSLSVRHVTTKDAGDYLCIARNKVSDDYRLLRVSVGTKPAKIEQKQPLDQMVSIGKPLKVDCQASGLPDPTVQWSLPDGTMVNSVLHGEDRGGRGRRLTVFNNGTLLVSAVGTGEEGEYICYAENQGGQDTMKVKVKVMTGSSPAFTDDRHNQVIKVREGATARISCPAAGEPPPTVTWFSPTHRIIPRSLGSGYYSERVVVVSGGVLEVRVARQIDSGNYTCRASNSAGERSTVVGLEVEAATHGLSSQVGGRSRGISSWPGVRSEVNINSGGYGSTSGITAKLGSNNSSSDNDGRIRNTLPNASANLAISGSNPALKNDTQSGFNRLLSRITTQLHSGLISEGLSRPRDLGIKADNIGINKNGPGAITSSINVGNSGNTVRGDSNRNPNNEVITGSTRNNANISKEQSSNVGGSSSSVTNNAVGVSTHSGNGFSSRRNSGSSVGNTDAKNVANTAVGMVTTVKEHAVKGQTVFLPCSPLSSPQPRLFWLLPGNGMLPAPYYGSRFTVHRNGTLEVRGVRTSDGGILICVVRSERGEVTVRVELEVLEPQKETGLPQRGAVFEQVVQKSPGSNKVSAQTFRTASAVVFSPKSSVTEKPLQRNLSLPVTPRLIVPPPSKAVITKNGQLVSIISEETLHLSCPVSQSLGHTQDSLLWTMPSGKVLSRGENSDSGRYFVQEDGTLIVRQASVFDRGTYSCKSTNYDSSVSVITIPVIVIAYLPRITTGPAPMTYTHPGVAVELPCLSIATPRATVTWETPDLMQLRVMGQPRIYGNRYLSPQGSLVIQNPTSRDTGFYRCTAKNVIGADTKATYLHVI